MPVPRTAAAMPADRSPSVISLMRAPASRIWAIRSWCRSRSRTPRATSSPRRGCIGRAGGAEIGSLQRVDRDVDLRVDLALGPAAAERLADVQHGGLVALSFADDHRSAHLEAIELFAHRLDG